MRVMAPDGSLGEVPEDQIEAALAAGGRLMTSADLKEMFNRLHLEHSLFKESRKRALEGLKKRTVTRMRGRRR